MEFKEQIWPIKDRLFRLAYRVVDDRAEAEDVVQEVMIKLWRQGQDLRLVKNLEAWCFRLTRNLALDKLKGGYRKRRTELPTDNNTLRATDQPDKILEAQDGYQRIRSFIQALPEQHRAVMHLRDIEGLSYQEIADALNMSMPQVKTNLFRARKAVRTSILNYETT
ncbi:MAG: sigma-70 family RNA polymerase sigma factor [Bacteroidota bacterium]